MPYSPLPQATLLPQLRKTILPVLKRLPQIKEQQLDGEPSYYGASWQIARQLGMSAPLPSGASWVHGWVHNPLVNLLLVSARLTRQSANLTGTEEQAVYLRERGYAAHAVGVPILYAPPSGVTRMPGSMLVMPMHSTSHVAHGHDHPDFLPALAELHKEFDITAACVSGMCVQQGLWTGLFESLDIPWVTGAWIFDRNALARMRVIFESFEYIATNFFGSHIAYAAWCGCKIRFFGDMYVAEKQTLLKEPFYAEHPELIDIVLEHNQLEVLRKRFPFLFNNQDATHKEWGAQVLGLEHKKNPEEMARLLGWINSKADMPQETKRRHVLDPERVLIMARRALEQRDFADALRLASSVKGSGAVLENADSIRAQAFLGQQNPHAAYEALKEELRLFPHNRDAQDALDKLQAALFPEVRPHDEFSEILARIRPYTMVGTERLASLYRLAKIVCLEDVPGNFVECGVAAGGSSALLAWVIRKYSRRERLLYAFDSFAGMPEPTAHDTHQSIPADATGWGTGTCAAPESSLLEICAKLEVQDMVRPVKGLFCDTLPERRAEIGTIALLHMDGDWYESTRDILENLYTSLPAKAPIQVDDYGYWQGCRQAVHEFEGRQGLRFDLQPIDGIGVWFRKPSLGPETGE
ncbi:TylF/MycF/NovP-related O-methyltransferase [Desulfomicrobium orale]|uniref:Macrocin O-methyltransferase n=1 Tax=Desulfomicrobium orale DSM 12838 TaxID=888061 RepID=A0A0X8JN18_9BACT|nr:TylF/MycF/NovP-related O-methyltransferase [Desulfomicrobium orale]AMD91770.1 hypothetical protein AXF15_00645 [Desulfomicrobium orale DSM 12838]